ncbi:MAG: cupin domain-containing protein [Lachnospiraceae bacterium]|nr:cupin domain-containing protein [Lachnospiraceae bacterium]
MNIVLLSGGSGKRLWPLSNDIRSKQFIKLFKRPEGAEEMGETFTGEYESMVQRVYRQIKKTDPEAKITIATSKSQVSIIRNQLGTEVGISVEPCRRDTFPAIALATAYLHYVQGVSLDEAMVVCPVDPYVDDGFFEALKKLNQLASEGTANLVLLGIDPTYPSAKYGYIMPESGDTIAKVRAFKEKPDEPTAAEYIKEGGLWNGGVFAYKLRYVLERAHELIDFIDYTDLYSKYDTLTKVSFDYAVVEHEPDIAVMRFTGPWKDLGTWNTLTEAMEDSTVGDARLDETCSNVHVVNELGVPILVMGGKDMVVSASPDGILVSDKIRSAAMKPYVEDIAQQVMFAEKTWGIYRVLDIEEGSMTVKVTLNPGHRMNYHSHEHRDEVWTVLGGSGYAIVDGMEQPLKPGDVITMAAGCRHTVIAGETGLHLIEVQIGSDISAGDKHKFEMPE